MTATTSIAVPAYVSQFAGAPFYMHAIAMAAAYNVRGLWTPSRGSHVRLYGPPFIRDCWEHPGYADHVLHTPRPSVLVVTQLTGTPDLQQLEFLGEEALGPGVRPTDVVRYPLCIRVPLALLVPIGSLPFHVPNHGMHLRRVWPPPGTAPFMTTVRGRRVEIRLNGNREGSGLPTLSAAAFVGRAFETKMREPRSRFFAADARYVLIEPNQHELEMFTAHLLDALLNFVHDEGPKLGVFLDPSGQLPGTQLGKIHSQRLEDDVEYRIRLPLPNGPRHPYVGTPGLPAWYR